MRISLNLATRPFADIGPALRRLRITMGALALAAIGLGVGLHAMHQKAEAARERAHSLDSQIAQITRERQGYVTMMRRPENAAVLAQAERLNALFDEKAFSWTLAMEDLETVLPGGVQVTSIEPTRDKQGHITLHLRVLGPRDRAIELVANLEHSRHFVEPRIVGESAETSSGPGQQLEPVSASNRVNFELLAEYNPVQPSEHKVGKDKKQLAEDAEARTPLSPDTSPATSAGLRRPPYTGMARPKTIPKPHAGGAR